MSFRSGYITIIGVPNAGKSSLVNALVREHVSIVTSKPQTTRKRTLGVLTEPNQYQMIFVDTPGVIESEDGLNPFLKQELSGALKDVDVVVCAMAPWEFKDKKKPWSLEMGEKLKNPIYILTQADREVVGVDPVWKSFFSAQAPGLLYTSSKTGLGLEDLKKFIYTKLSEGPQYYDVDLYTPQNMRELASEIIRKKCFENLHQELPYGLAILVQDFEEGELYKITADILLSRDSHKPIIIGKGGAVLKRIGTEARYELEKIFGKRIFLKLHVTVKPGWLKDKGYLKELGYEAN